MSRSWFACASKDGNSHARVVSPHSRALWLSLLSSVLPASSYTMESHNHLQWLMETGNRNMTVWHSREKYLPLAVSPSTTQVETQPLESKGKHTGSTRAASGRASHWHGPLDTCSLGIWGYLPAGRGVGCSEGERQEGSPSPPLHGKQQWWLPGSAFPQKHPNGKAATRSREQDTWWPSTLVPAPTLAKHPCLSWEVNMGSPLKLLQSELTRNSLQHQPSGGLSKLHLSSKLTPSPADQGSCLVHLHGKGMGISCLHSVDLGSLPFSP